MRNYIKGFNRFSVNEQDEEEKEFRLYGEGYTSQAQLIDSLKNLIKDIEKFNPSNQDDYNSIKEDIKNRVAEIKAHKDFEEFKRGIPWQDTYIRLDDWSAELKDAVNKLSLKATKKGLV